MDIFIKNSVVTSKYIDHFIKIMDIIISCEEFNEGDLCFPSGVLENINHLNSWLLLKKISINEAILSFESKQKNFY
jgi:hypothetical protein